MVSFFETYDMYIRQSEGVILYIFEQGAAGTLRTLWLARVRSPDRGLFCLYAEVIF